MHNDSAAAREPTGPRPGVLVLDPDEDARLIAAAVLEAAGLRVTTVAAGAAALATLRGARAGGGPGVVAVVVGELYVPVDSHPCALRAVKSDPALSRLSFLVYTAHARPADREWALANGCDAYLAKPAPPTALQREVLRLLGGAGAG